MGLWLELPGRLDAKRLGPRGRLGAIASASFASPFAMPESGRRLRVSFGGITLFCCCGRRCSLPRSRSVGGFCGVGLHVRSTPCVFCLLSFRVPLCKSSFDK